MHEFIFEDEIEKVTSKTTKHYLAEVLSTYEHGNYRATIVVLYSIVLFDLHEKLIILRDVYQDVKAQLILDELGKKEREKKPYSERERYLLDSVRNFHLLNEIEVEKIEQLRQARNWCAHPVYNNDYKLINPNREETRAHMRNCFESVFHKEALLSRDVLFDVIQVSHEFYERVGLDGLERHLIDRFFSKMTQSVKDKLFSSLWKFTFVLNNSDCTRTRTGNYYALLYLVRENPNHYFNIMSKEAKFSSLSVPERGIEWGFDKACISNSPSEALIFFLSEYPIFFTGLTTSAHALLKGIAFQNMRYLTISYYLSDSLAEHIKLIKETRDARFMDGNGYVNAREWNVFIFEDIIRLYNISCERGVETYIKEFIIELFVKSPNFWNTDTIWGCILPIIDIFTHDELLRILEGMNQNSQIYGNRNRDAMIREILKITGTTITQVDFPNLV